MSSDKKRKVLSYSDKVSILKKIDENAVLTDIAKEYGVTTSAISKIKARRDEILSTAAACSANDLTLKKSRKTAAITKLDDAVYLWFSQERLLGEPVSGPVLCEKARTLNEKMQGPASFKASVGWLDRFKKRHGIRQLSMQGESGKKFTAEFNDYTEENQFSVDNIYNAHETGLYWRSLPRETLASLDECAADARDKDTENRVTVMLCANASGNHRLPLLMIGKLRNPRCFENVTCLPVIYRAQRSSCMDRPLFVDWYNNHFIPIVECKQEESGRRGKVLLLLDNAPSHPPADVLNAVNENFHVMYIPPDVTAILQPMDRGPIGTIKKLYKQQLLRRLLLREEKTGLFLQKLSLKDCCEMIASAWNEMTASQLRNVWKPLVENNSFIHDAVENAENASLLQNLTLACNRIAEGDVSKEDIATWLNDEDNNHGWEVLSDERILAIVNGHNPVKDPDDVNKIDNKWEPDNESELDAIHEEVSARNIIENLTIVYRWLEKHPQCRPGDLEGLMRIQNLAYESASTYE